MNEDEKMGLLVSFEMYLEDSNRIAFERFKTHKLNDILVKIELKKFMLEKGYFSVISFDEYFDKVMNQI